MTTGATPTGNPWSALRDYTRSHPAGSRDPLKFEPDVALDLSAAASQVVMAINGLQQFIADLSVGEPVSGLGSGAALGAKFGAKASELDAIFDKHKSILGDMIETFVAAGKAYGDMDGFNSGLLDNVQSRPGEKWEFDGMPTTIAPPAPPNNPTAGTLPGTVTAVKSYEQSTIMGESADSMSWLDLYQVGNYIRVHTVVADLSGAAGTWGWMAEEIDGAFVDFVNKVDAVTEGQWTGPGKEVAVAAVKAYANSVPALGDAVKGVADLLFYTAGWLDSTQRWMPMTPTNPAGTLLPSGYTYSGGYVDTSYSVTEDQTPMYRENFRKTYLAGLAQSSTHVPVLPPAEGAFGTIPSNPYTPGGNGGGNGGGQNQGGNGGGQHRGGNGGGNPGGGQRAGAGLAPGVQELFDKGENPATEAAALTETGAYTPTDPKSLAQQFGTGTTSGVPQLPGQQLPDGQQPVANARQIAGKPGSLAPGSAAEDQFLTSAAQQLMAAAQQGLPQLQQAFQQFAQSLTPEQQRELLRRAGLDSIPGIEIPEDAASGDPTALETLAANLAGGAGAGGGGGGGGGFGPGAGTFLAQDPSHASKLFPRAASFGSFAETQFEAAAKSTAATAGTPGTPGSPGAAGAAGAGANQGGGQHKRAGYLESTEHLEEALGDAPVVVRPVVER
ncbi:hypothetical protein [Nocardia higoensis]|uniref:hypothetical protein n=1 Tax=Nocardia higoensis TaxID=228599 RepID=UPI0002ED509E|nr:hypothetical protein [Nocardia higoensis]